MADNINKLAAVPENVRGYLKHLAQACAEKTHCRSEELRDLSKVYEGGQALVEDESKFPCPAGTDYATWANLRRRLMVVVNLLKASVRDTRARVYGGGAVREILRNPHKPDVEKVISNGRFARDMRHWFTNKLIGGTAAAVPIVRTVGENGFSCSIWIPDPCFTFLVVDRADPDDYEFLAEIDPDGTRIQYVSKYGEGVFYVGDDKPVAKLRISEAAPLDRSWHRPAEWGFFPGTVGHAEDRRNKRDPYSSPPMKDAVRTVLRATDTLFNGAILQKLQTKGILGIYGRLESNSGQPQDFAEMMRAGVVTLTEGSRMEWAVPESRIPDTIELLTKIVQMFAVIEGLPVDSLDPSSMKGTAAAEAERRDAPANNIADEYAEGAALDEANLILKITALMQFYRSGGPVNLDDLRGQVETEISLLGNLLPGFTQERAQTTQMLVDMGAMTPMDAAKLWNRRASPKKLAEIAHEIEEARAIRLGNIERAGNAGGNEPGAAEPAGGPADGSEYGVGGEAETADGRSEGPEPPEEGSGIED